jgi:hypothetical protein
MQAVLVSQGSQGNVVLASDGSFTYTPGNGFTGQDTFTYQVQLGVWASNVATVTLRSGPVVHDGTYEVEHDLPITPDGSEGVLATASNPSGSPMQASTVLPPNHAATFSLQADGSFTYQPVAGYVGPDSFQFQASADGLSSNIGTIQIDVVDQAPDAPDTSYEMHAGQTLQIDAPGLGEVASDPDQVDTIHFVLDPGSGPSHGTLTFPGDGSFSYQPAANFVGTDSFRYHTNDGALDSPTSGTVTIQVTDQAPVAGDVSYDVQAGTGAHDTTRTILSNSNDPDGDPLTAQLVSGPSQATAFTLFPDGTFSYTPRSGYTGPDTFTFVAFDGWLTSQPATVTLQVGADLVAHDHYYLCPTSGTLTVSPSQGLLQNVFDPSGDSLMAQVLQGPDYGSVDVHPDGGFVYTAGGQGPPSTSFTFLVRDVVNGNTASAVVRIFFQIAAPTLTSYKLFTRFNGSELRVSKDDGSGTYDPTWQPGQPIPITALIAGRATQAEADFSLVPSTVDAYKAMLSSLSIVGDDATWDPGRIVTPTFQLQGNVLKVTWKDFLIRDTALLRDASQHWTIFFPGTPQIPISTIGTSTHEVYVLAGAPVDGVKLFYTVVAYGTAAANGLSLAQNRDQIIANAELGFGSGEDLYRLTPIERPLSYYGDWRVGSVGRFASRTTASLLLNLDGNCEAWVEFFRDILRTQGIGKDVIKEYKMMHKAGPFGVLFVANWQARPGMPLVNHFPATQAVPVDHANKAYTWVAPSPIEKKPGIKGRNQLNPDPVALFRDHVIVEILIGAQAGLFDPSYGLSGPAFGNYADQAFDYAGVIGPSPNPNSKQVAAVRITAANAATYIIRIP